MKSAYKNILIGALLLLAGLLLYKKVYIPKKTLLLLSFQRGDLWPTI